MRGRLVGVNPSAAVLDDKLSVEIYFLLIGMIPSESVTLRREKIGVQVPMDLGRWDCGRGRENPQSRRGVLLGRQGLHGAGDYPATFKMQVESLAVHFFNPMAKAGVHRGRTQWFGALECEPCEGRVGSEKHPSAGSLASSVKDNVPK
jgi:hypothetical protein